jgi:hypothetical protein
MPRPTIGDAPMTPAQRQQRRRERLRIEAEKRQPRTKAAMMARIKRLEREVARLRATVAT